MDFEEAVRLLEEHEAYSKIPLLVGHSSGHVAKWLNPIMLGADETLEEHAAEHLSRFLSEAYQSAIGFDRLKAFLAAQIRAERPIPYVLRMWLADYLSGRISRPKSTGSTDVAAGRMRDYMIAMAIDFVVRLGFSPYRNAASEPLSACDVVVEFLKRNGVNVSYSKVAKVCQNYKFSSE